MTAQSRSKTFSSLAAVALALCVSTGSTFAQAAAEAPAKKANPMVTMKTSLGDMKIELFQDKAPISVENFLKYVDAKYYDGTVYHRVIKTFMIQGGGFNEDLMKKPGVLAPIKNEATNGLKNERGTLAMARTSDINSATCQFFINVVDNKFLDHTAATPRGFGYAVFGKVTEGMAVVDKIKAVQTGRKGPFPKDVPQETVKIIEVRRAK